MKKKLLGTLMIALLLALFVFPFGVSASEEDEKIQINGVDVQGSYTATGISYTQVDDSDYYDTATLTLSDGASISSLDFGNLTLTIIVNGNVTISGSLAYEAFTGSKTPQDLTITGSGTLTVGGGLSNDGEMIYIEDGVTVNVTNPNGNAIVADGLRISGGSNVTATGSTNGVVTYGFYPDITVSEGSSLTATGNNGYGIDAYYYGGTTFKGADLDVTGNSTVTAKGTGNVAINLNYASKYGTLTLDETSTLNLSSSGSSLLIGNTSFPSSFQWTTGGTTSQAPYDSCDINSHSSLVIKGNSVYVPKMSPASGSTTTLYLQDTGSQTFTVSPATSVAAPSTVSY